MTTEPVTIKPIIMNSHSYSKYIGIFLISMATLLLELSLTRILSVGFFFHFGFMVISTAMLGFGVAGTLLAVYKNRFENTPLDNLVSWLSFVFGILTLLTYVIAQYIPFNPFHIFSDFKQGVLFPVYYITLSIPFIFSGLIIALLFTFTPDKISRLYSWDLVGAGLGCLIVSIVIPTVGGVGAILVASGLSFASAAVFCYTYHVKRSISFLLITLIVFVLSPKAEKVIPIRITEGKENNLIPTNSKPVFSKWNTMSKIDVYQIGSIGKGIFKDSLRWIQYDGGTALSQVLDYRPSIEKYILNLQANATKEDTLSIHSSLAFLMAKENPKVLIIGSAGGKEVMHSLFYRASKIDAIEINPLLNELVGNYMADYAGHIYDHPNVHVYTENARTFIKRTSEKYDIIISSHTLSNAAIASGAMSLAEDYIYTKEAFDEYWNHLTDDGILFLTRPNTDFPRFTTTLKQVINEHGIDNPENHLMIGETNFYASKREMTLGDISKGAYILQTPVDSILHKSNGNLLFFNSQNDKDNIYYKILNTDDLTDLYSQLPTKISPGTDDSPFISHKFKWSSLNYELLKSTFNNQDNVSVGSRLARSNPIAEFILIILLVQTVIIAGVMILLPLIKAKRQAVKSKLLSFLPPIFYFSGLGLGFIMLEMALLQKYQLYLGQPIYTYAVILGTLLVCTGIGSLMTSLFNDKKKLLTWLFPIICVVLVLYYTLIPVLFESTLSLPLSARLIIASFSILPLGILLGMPFPTGLSLLSQQTELIPWAWGVNSFFTVIGTIISIIIGMTFGFLWVMTVATMCYLISLIASRFFRFTNS